MIFKADSFSQSPLVFDLLHLILLVATILFVILWLQARRASSAAVPDAITQKAEPAPVEPVSTKPEPPEPSKLHQSSPESALQLLSLLQAESRFIDFVQEDLSQYSDADIGAVARVVHEGSRKTLDQYVDLAPIRDESEESSVTLEAGFDPSRVRLTGRVAGEPPFTGTLIHRGWQVTRVSLPQVADGHDTRVLAPAEVELA